MRSELRCGILMAPTGFARGSGSSRDARCDVERARERCDAHAESPLIFRARNRARRGRSRASPSEIGLAFVVSGRHGCTTTPTFTRIGYPERELTTTFPSPPRCDSESVKASAAKPAIVEKVEKLGKAALSGLAASAILASVRPRLNNDIPRGRERSTVSARARPDARGERGPPTRGDILRRPFTPFLPPGSRARARGAARARLSPRPARGFHHARTGWWLEGAQLCDLFSVARADPFPRPTEHPSLTRRFPSLSSLVLFSSPRTPSPTTSSRASPTSR